MERLKAEHVAAMAAAAAAAEAAKAKALADLEAALTAASEREKAVLRAQLEAAHDEEPAGALPLQRMRTKAVVTRATVAALARPFKIHTLLSWARGHLPPMAVRRRAQGASQQPRKHVTSATRWALARWPRAAAR